MLYTLRKFFKFKELISIDFMWEEQIFTKTIRIFWFSFAEFMRTEKNEYHLHFIRAELQNISGLGDDFQSQNPI